MKCRPLRVNDQMQCHCGLAWDITEDKPECAGDVVNHNYAVTAEVYEGNKYLGQKVVNTTAPHCSVAAKQVEKLPGHFVIDARRV